MNWLAISAVGEIIGALAVVCSLIYLGNQVRNSNRIATNESESSLTALSTHVSKSAKESSVLMLKLKDSNLKLTPEEKVESEYLASEFMNMWGSAASAYRNGLIAKYLFEMYMTDLEVNLTQYPGLCLAVYENYISRWSELPDGESILMDRMRKVFRKNGLKT